MVVGHGPIVFAGDALDRVDAGFDLLGRRGGDEPTVAEASDAAHGGLAASADPDGGAGLLDRRGVHDGVVHGVEASVEGHGLTGPEEAHEDHGLIRAGAALLGGYAGGLEVLGCVAAQADTQEQATAGEVVQGGQLLGEDDGVSRGQDHDAGAELHGGRARGDEGHEGGGLQGVSRADDAVAEPEGVDAQLFAAVDEVQDSLDAALRGGPCADAQADADFHALLLRRCVQRWGRSLAA